MCQQRWGEIQYKALPAACLTKHAKSFEKHDPVRFREFMDKVECGKVRVNTGALQPHEILKRASGCGTDAEKALAQGQWRAMLERIREAGQLQDCIAVCDVSGSMSCEAAPGVSCMDVAIAMSLLVAELASGPVARQVITFHESPTMATLPNTSDLAELADFVRRLNWGGSTNFHKVFQLLLQKEASPKKILVFSDMQFAPAGGNTTVLRQIQENYRRAGRAMPELVFWNLRGTSGAPALATDEGVVLISGFSSRMLKLVTESGPDPLAALSQALDNPLCAKGRVIQDPAEVWQLMAGPWQAVHTFAAEVEASDAQPDQVAERDVPAPARKQPSTPRTLTTQLATLPCRVAEAALVGKGGQNIQQLRQLLHDRLCHELDAGRFRFWLDVRDCSLLATVEAAKTSFEEQQLHDALAQLKAHIPRSVVYNKVRHVLGIDGLLAPRHASSVLASLPTQRALLAFLGRKGCRIQALQAELQSLLDAQLPAGSFSFCLDVQLRGVSWEVATTLEVHATWSCLVGNEGRWIVGTSTGIIPGDSPPPATGILASLPD